MLAPSPVDPPPKASETLSLEGLDRLALSPEQRSAVVHGAEDRAAPPLLIIAGAGSGKTRTLAARLAYLIACGHDPARILLMTFSRRAAVELERRAGEILHQVLKLGPGSKVPTLPWAGTFHSVGARLLRDYAPRIGLSDSFTIHDRADAADLMGLARHELALSEARNRFPGKDTCLAIYSRAVNSQAPLRAVLAQNFPWCAAFEPELKKLFGRYVNQKQAQNVLDYDDLLLYWAEMAAEPELGLEIGARFAHVLVDEYQDTNRLQASILMSLKPCGQGLTVVGDDAQSIYSFRAADVRNILDFPDQFEPRASCITLERNYRSTTPILAASNAVIGLARERFKKHLWSERTRGPKPVIVTVADESVQARYVADQVLILREEGMLLRDQAVLFRSSSHSAPLELELARRNIPFVKYGGLKFLEATHVKDVLALLRWAQNPRSRIAGFRVLLLVPGVGPATAARLLDALDTARDIERTFVEFDAPAGACDGLNDLAEAFAALRQRAIPWPADFERARQWVQPHLERRFEDAPARSADLIQLGRIAATYGSRQRFLTELTLDPPDATSDVAGPPHLDEDYLVLSTIHSAKGQEWSAVTVVNLVDGCIPSDMATASIETIEEERRLLYVAMTRAKDRLALLVPQRFYIHQQSAFGDHHVYAQRSRFVPDSLVDFFEHLAWPPAPTNLRAADGAGASGVSCDVALRLRNRWD